MHNDLAKELTMLLSKKANEVITITSPDYSEIVSQMDDIGDCVLVTNDNYLEEGCNYQVLCFNADNQPFVMFLVDEYGTVIYPFRNSNEPLEAEDLIAELKTWISRIKVVYVVDMPVNN